MDLYQISFSAADFHALPSPAQVFFVRMSQVRNDIRHLTNLMRAGVAAVDSYTGHEQRVASHQLLFAVRQVCAALTEACKIIKAEWRAGGLHSRYGGQLKPSADAALHKFEAYASDSVMKKVRNKFAAHYDGDVLRKTLATMRGREEQTLLSSKHSGNVFYVSAEEVRTFAMLSARRSIAPRAEPFQRCKGAHGSSPIVR